MLFLMPYRIGRFLIFGNYVRSFEALAEIFDFVAGLVHSSKEAERSESDLQNSTARLRE